MADETKVVSTLLMDRSHPLGNTESALDGRRAIHVKIKNATDGSEPIKVSLESESIEIGTVDQGSPATNANAWPVKPTDGTNSQGYTNASEAKVSLTTALPSGANVIGGVNQGTSPWVTSRNWNTTFASDKIDASGSSVSVSASALPAGAATETTVSSILGVYTASGSAVTRVASSATSVTLISANASRKGLILFNESTKVCYVKFGTTASATDYTIQMDAKSSFILESNPIYTGRIDAIWASANGACQVTELT